MTEITYVKIDDNTIRMIKELDPITTTITYASLVTKMGQAVAARERCIQARQKEIDDIDVLLAKCAELGVGAEVIPDE